MKYFITGVAGFVGSQLAKELIRQGHEVVGVDNLSGGFLENIPAGVDFHQMDCDQRDSMHLLMEGVDVVFHAACTAHEGLSVFSPYFITHNTFDITASVLSAAVERRVKRFVYMSSMARYGSQGMHPFVETMQPKPQDPYAIAKYAGEMLVREVCETHGIEYAIAIPHNIIGPGQNYTDPYRNVVSIWINLMLQGKDCYIYGDGEQKRCFSFISDVIDPLLRLAHDPAANGEAFNIGPDQDVTTINEMFKITAELVGYHNDAIHIPARPREVRESHCSADKARRMLGYEPKKELRAGVQEMIDDIKRKGAKPFVYNHPVEIDSPMLPETWKKKLF